MTKAQFDIIIVGGGLVGVSLALALRQQGLAIAMVEAVPPRVAQQPGFDARTLALSWTSHQVLSALGLWAEIAPHVTPMEHIHVSDKGHFGFTRLHARDYHVPALGYVIEIQRLGKLLYETLEQTDVTRFCPATLEQANRDGNTWELTIRGESGPMTLTTGLLIGADGAQSPLRQQLQLTTREKDYQQSAIVTTVSTSLAHDNTAFERFTPKGPIALLPMTHDRQALIWTLDNGDFAPLMALSDELFLQQVQQSFGYRRGKFLRVGKRMSYPLKFIHCEEQVREGFVLLGNAAHTLHPVAAQGFNLCLRDIAELAEVVVNAKLAGNDFASLATLDTYQARVNQYQSKTIKITDSIVKYFSDDPYLLTKTRNAGLVLLDTLPMLKRRFVKRTMGTAGNLPKLCRGLEL
ncbi:MAG: 2-octaprenyl-6-methoxyphenyl hydroxylase [Legionellales bacterium]|nr:2-octaprenyl-6-methoxyphenyl hydroxylase [Legionellales bacterium]|tara:strand:+ start:55874 stop:57094 length:1221 start_codon:yes stop_codon:yes gene_type:complete